METKQKMVDSSHPEIMYVFAKTHTFVNDITAVIIHPFYIMIITEVNQQAKVKKGFGKVLDE